MGTLGVLRVESFGCAALYVCHWDWELEDGIEIKTWLQDSVHEQGAGR